MILGFSGESWDFLDNLGSFWKIPDVFGQLFCDVEFVVGRLHPSARGEMYVGTSDVIPNPYRHGKDTDTANKIASGSLFLRYHLTPGSLADF